MSDLEYVDEDVGSFPNELGEGSDFERFAQDNNTPLEEGEFCQGNPVQVRVGGRLREHITSWEALEPPEYALKGTSFLLLHYHNHRYSGTINLLWKTSHL